MFNRFLTNVAWLVGAQLVAAGLSYWPLDNPPSEEERMALMAHFMVLTTVIMGMILSGRRKFMAWVATGFMCTVILVSSFINSGVALMQGSSLPALASPMLASCVVYDVVFIGMLLLFGRKPMRPAADNG